MLESYYVSIFQRMNTSKSAQIVQMDREDRPYNRNKIRFLLTTNHTSFHEINRKVVNCCVTIAAIDNNNGTKFGKVV